MNLFVLQIVYNIQKQTMLFPIVRNVIMIGLYLTWRRREAAATLGYIAVCIRDASWERG